MGDAGQNVARAKVEPMFQSSKPYLESLSAGAAEAIREHLEPRELLRGETIFREGEKPRWMFLVEKGWVKVGMSSPNGKEVITEILFPGEFCGVTCGLLGDVYWSTGTLLQDGLVSFVEQDIFLRLCREHPSMLHCGMATCCAKQRQKADMFAALASESTPQRTARILLYLAKRLGKKVAAGVEFVMPLDRRQLSELVGSAPESTIRALSELRSKKLFRQAGARVLLPDTDGLRMFVDPSLLIYA